MAVRTELERLILCATYEPNGSTHPDRRADRVAAALVANPDVVLRALGGTQALDNTAWWYIPKKES